MDLTVGDVGIVQARVRVEDGHVCRRESVRGGERWRVEGVSVRAVAGLGGHAPEVAGAGAVVGDDAEDHVAHRRRGL